MQEISIILTTYMLQDYVAESIKSILTQKYNNYELIIVDDGSGDNTEKEILKFRDKNIKFIKLSHTGLPAKVRNTGVKLAIGKYIAFFDGDDIWYPDKLSKCLEIMKKNPAIDVVCHDCNLFRSGDRKTYRRTFFGPYKDNLYEQLLLEGNVFSVSCSVMKSSLFLRDNYYFSEDENMYTVEDYDLWLRLAASKRYQFYYLPEVLGAHRVCKNSSTLRAIDTHTLNMLYLFDNRIRELGFVRGNTSRKIRKRKSQIMLGAALAFNYMKRFNESLLWNYMAIKECPFYLKPYLSFLISLCRIKCGYI